MKKTLLLAMGIAGLALASTKPVSIQLSTPAVLGTTTLAPGEYRVEVVGEKAVVRNGRKECEAPVQVKEGDVKYNATAVRYETGDGKMHIQEIHIGGTKTKLVFSE